MGYSRGRSGGLMQSRRWCNHMVGINLVSCIHPIRLKLNVCCILFFYIYFTPTCREGAILQSPCPSVHTFVTDISASTGRNDFIFDIWLWHDDLYCVSPFQVYRTSTSCLVWLTNERVGVFLARRSVQHLVSLAMH